MYSPTPSSFNFAVWDAHVLKSFASKTGHSYDRTEAFNGLVAALKAVRGQYGSAARVGFTFNRDLTEISGTHSMDVADALDAVLAMQDVIVWSGR